MSSSGVRGREHHDRDRRQGGIALDLLQHLDAVQARQVQVEQHEPGPAGGGVLPLAAQEGQRLDSVADDGQLVGNLVVLERLSDQHDVAGIVLDQQNSDEFRIHGLLSSVIGRVNRMQVPPE